MTASDEYHVHIPERGDCRVDSSVFLRISADDDFWQLVKRGIISVNALSDGSVKLRAGPWVGSAFVGGVRLSIEEKIAGSLGSLIRYAQSNVRVEQIPSLNESLNAQIVAIVRRFIAELEVYVGYGRRFSYVTTTYRGTTISGRLRLADTIRLHAEGHRTEFYYDQASITRDVPFNQLMFAALLQCEAIHELYQLSFEIYSQVQAYARLFEDCRRRLADDHDFDLFRKELELSEDYSELKNLAETLLEMKSAGGLDPEASRVRASWFVNLEKHFEGAVLIEFKKSWKGDVSTGATDTGDDRTIFNLVDDRYRADPDLVLHEPLCVGDSKYKEFTGIADAGDLYQLLVHATTFKAQFAFLVFPDDHFHYVKLGRSSTGQITVIYALDIRDISQGVRAIVSDITHLCVCNPTVSVAK